MTATRRRAATWAGFIVLVATLVGAHLWLWWMWPLWDAPHYLLHNVNTVVGLLAIDLLIAILAVTVLLLIYRSAAPALLAAVWVLYPLTLIGVAITFPDQETMLAAENLRVQVMWLTPLVLLPGVSTRIRMSLAHLGHVDVQ